MAMRSVNTASPTLLSLVSLVVLNGPDEEMVRSDASGVVAAMADLKTSRDGPVP